MSLVRCDKKKKDRQCRLTLGHMGFHSYDDKQWWPLRKWCVARANGLCEVQIEDVCTGRAQDAHHVVPRSRGGADELGNLKATCRACHDWIHRNVEEATRLGLLRTATEGAHR